MTGTSLHTKNALALALLLLCAAPFGVTVLASASLGGGVQVLNLRLLERAVAFWLGGRAHGLGGLAKILIAFRFVALMGLCAALIVLLPVNAVAFAAGFSSVVPAAIWHGFETARRGA